MGVVHLIVEYVIPWALLVAGLSRFNLTSLMYLLLFFVCFTFRPVVFLPPPCNDREIRNGLYAFWGLVLVRLLDQMLEL